MLTPSGILPEADPIQPLPMPASPRKTAAQEAQTSAEEWNGPTRDPNTSGGAFPPNLSRLSCRAESKHRVASPPTADRLSNGWSHWHQAPLARAEGMVMGPGWWRASGVDHGWLGSSRAGRPDLIGRVLAPLWENRPSRWSLPSESVIPPRFPPSAYPESELAFSFEL